MTVKAGAQTSPQPDAVPGANRIIYNLADSTYNFYLDADLIYSFRISSLNGTLNNLRSYDYSGSWYLPSNAGGPMGFLSGKIVEPWDEGVTYHLLNYKLYASDSLSLHYQMNYNSDYFRYYYTLLISGRTLIIHVTADPEVPDEHLYNCAGFDLDRCENAINPEVVRVPYLTLFNLLSSNDMFTSMFFDWETTSASELKPKTPDIYDVTIDGVKSFSSKRFSQTALYNPKTDGTRNILDETIYLTTSSSADAVMPNLVTPAEPAEDYEKYKDEIADRTVISWGPPYTFLNNPPVCSNYTVSSLDPEYQRSIRAFPDAEINYGGVVYYKCLNLLSDLGIKGLAFIIQNYQRAGYDRGLPNVMPANTFENCEYDCLSQARNADSAKNGNSALSHLRAEAESKGYMLALHENYVDAFDPQIPINGFNLDDCSLNPDGSYRRNYTNNCGDKSYVISPGSAAKYLNNYSSLISRDIAPDWSYLDVHSAIDPADVTDYNAARRGAGLFRYVLQQYRKLPEILSKFYNGPVEGEGSSKATFLYAGYYHDLEARLHTADYNIYGTRTPLFVDFDLYKIHGRSALHGVGQYYVFYSPKPGGIDTLGYMTTPQMLRYIGYELAFGHSGFITKVNIKDQTIKDAEIEYKYVYPVQKLYKNSSPASIVYFKDGAEVGNSSEYIKRYPDYWNIDSSNFMSQVKVTYENGIIVYVNASMKSVWQITPPANGSLYYYDKSGIKSDGGNFTLPPYDGWLVYVPDGL